jgi:glycosyltransferase involved in cell wall biosynthesis
VRTISKPFGGHAAKHPVGHHYWYVEMFRDNHKSSAINPLVSVIIPTYNRVTMLKETLDSLSKQSFPLEGFEVIVVDDGGADGTNQITKSSFPYRLRYLWQENQGDAVARNVGALASGAEILVSLDDDMILEPDYLRYLVAAFEGETKLIAAGAWYLWLNETNPLSDNTRHQRISAKSVHNHDVPFVEINTHSLAIRRKELIELGLLQDLEFSGSRMWTDVDLAYRAYLEGYRFVRVGRAIVWHRDYVHKNLKNHKERMYTAGYRSVSLFHRYPELIHYLPMFEDKMMIDWRKDTPRLILRKVARRLSSTGVVLWSLEKVSGFLKILSPESSILGVLRRWIVGGSIFRGYRKGIKELARGLAR